ncbi:ubiquinone biosynthesis regulatory protein kinase UbiB [Algiphilus aromaticivorans]|uniref:ubiquinone biosynthesis regulatory protein kinase UbiB n=1 Tax=Algiphilus aromaticivorans TaxID=382454 RepID=UPI0005C19FE9|nr:ubiquinone biosynthesis regulatory protein kinase UbiB [Algiphilus aromaticivorans]
MKITRLWRILAVARRYRLRELLRGDITVDAAAKGERLRLALEELGPVFVKFGQALSTRPDLLPPEIATELARLQDRVPPFPAVEARAEIERALGRSIDEVYVDFEAEPMASASIAQVHGARLREADGGAGMAVIVKILRPGMREAIARDVALMYTLAGLIERLHPEGHRLRPLAIVAEFERILFDELDLMREGANCAQLRRNWLGSPLIYHPQVIWEATRPEVLTQERVFGTSIRDLEALRAQGVDFKKLSEHGVEIFFKQVFRDNFFHADMHPGNIIVDTTDPAEPGYLAVDFGIVGSLTPDDQRYLAENFLAFFNQDYRRVAELHVNSGWIPADTRVEDFESAIRTVCEPIFGKPIKDISFGFFLLRLFQIARRFRYEVQPQLVLLQKTLLQVEGLGRQLDPELDLWKTAKPIMEDWMRDRLSPARLSKALQRQAPLVIEALPRLAERALVEAEQPGVRSTAARLAQLEARIAEDNQRTRRSIIGATLILAAVGLGGMEAAGIGLPGGPALAMVSAALGAWSWWRAR